MDAVSAACTASAARSAAGTHRNPSVAAAETLTAKPRHCKSRFVVVCRNDYSCSHSWKRDPRFLAKETTFLMPKHDRQRSGSTSSYGGPTFRIRAFSERQEALVKESWEILRKDAGKHAMDFFLRVFEIAPSTKRMFSFLRDSDLPLEKNPKLKSHALKVFVITCEAAMSLRNKGKVVTPGSTLKSMADAHALSGVVDEHYDVVKFSLLKTIEEGLPAEKWSPEVKEAWAEAYDELVKAMKAETETDLIAH